MTAAKPKTVRVRITGVVRVPLNQTIDMPIADYERLCGARDEADCLLGREGTRANDAIDEELRAWLDFDDAAQDEEIEDDSFELVQVDADGKPVK